MYLLSNAAKQRGALGLMAAGLMVLMLLVLATLVNSASIYLAKRDLQRIADLSALETIALGGICTSNNAVASQQLAEQSASRNGLNLSNPGNTLHAQLGKIVTNAQGKRVLSSSAAGSSDAVTVTVRRQISSGILARLNQIVPSANQGNFYTIEARATAQRLSVAAFSVGSGLLRLDGQASPLLRPVLDALLDGNVNLDALSYSGVANANIALLDFLELLRAEAQLGTLEQLLNTRLQALPFVRVIANVLSQKNVLSTGLQNVTLAQASQLNLTLGQMLGVTSPTNLEALRAKVNLLDLLLVGAFAANNQNSLGLNLSLPNLASLRLNVIEKPKFAYGPPGKNANNQWLTYASTGQLELVANLSSSVNDLLPGIGYVVDAQLDLALRIGLAQANAGLASLNCNPTTGKLQSVTLAANTATDNIRVTQTSNASEPAIVTVKALGLTVTRLGVKAGGSAIIGSRTSDVVFNLNPTGTQPRFLDNPQTIYSPAGVGLPALTITSNVAPSCSGLECVTRAVLSPILSLLGGVLGLGSAVVSALSSVVIEPLLSALGIKLGYADLTMQDATFGSAQLVN